MNRARTYPRSGMKLMSPYEVVRGSTPSPCVVSCSWNQCHVCMSAATCLPDNSPTRLLSVSFHSWLQGPHGSSQHAHASWTYFSTSRLQQHTPPTSKCSGVYVESFSFTSNLDQLIDQAAGSTRVPTWWHWQVKGHAYALTRAHNVHSLFKAAAFTMSDTY